METKATKAKAASAPFENGDAFYGVFYRWLLAQEDEGREAVLRDGITLRRLTEDIATRKAVTPELRGRGKNGPSAGAYPYAVTACLRRRDYFVFRDRAALEGIRAATEDVYAYRHEGLFDAVVVPNPVSKDAHAHGFPFATLLTGGGGEAPARPGTPGRDREEEPDAPEVDAESEASDEGPAITPPRSRAPGRGFATPMSARSSAPSPASPVRNAPPARRALAPAWPTPAAPAPSPSPTGDEGYPYPSRPAGRYWPGDDAERRAPAPRSHAPFARSREERPRQDAPPRWSPAPTPQPHVPIPPPPPLPLRSAEELTADYLAASAGPPLVNLAPRADGRARYAGWCADLGREISPGKRSLDLRSERDLVALLFLDAAASLAGGPRAAADLLAGLSASNLVSMSFWRDEGTLLKVGAPKRIPFPQPLQLALHVIARNEGEIRAALGFDEILAGRKPAIDVERAYRTLMSDKMELPRYWRGPFKRNRRHRRLLPSRLGRVLVMRIPTLLRELHLQGVIDVDPAECCTADKAVRRAMFAAKIPVKKPINRMAALRENSRAIHERFGELFEMPLLLYGRSWRRR